MESSKSYEPSPSIFKIEDVRRAYPRLTLAKSISSIPSSGSTLISKECLEEPRMLLVRLKASSIDPFGHKFPCESCSAYFGRRVTRLASWSNSNILLN